MNSKSKRIKIPSEVRKYVFERDNYQCCSCGQTQDTSALEIDHIVSLAMGGTNDISNLQTLCRTCNARKKHHFDERFDRRFQD
jgi:5-methylcytosine-specific restriction protein A